AGRIDAGFRGSDGVAFTCWVTTLPTRGSRPILAAAQAAAGLGVWIGLLGARPSGTRNAPPPSEATAPQTPPRTKPGPTQAGFFFMRRRTRRSGKRAALFVHHHRPAFVGLCRPAG